MNKILRFSILLMALLSVLTFSSCHSTRKATVLTGTDLEKTRFEALVNSAYTYEAMQSKVRFSMGKTTLNGKICIESGKLFALSANAPLLGFEVGRIEASQESVLIVDKFDKLFCSVNIADLLEMDDLSGHEMEAVECLMLGRIFIPGIGKASAKDFSRLAWSTPTLPDGNMGLSTGLFEGKSYKLQYQINEQGNLVSTSLCLRDGNSISWKYENYQKVDKEKTMASAEEIHIMRSNGKSLELGISITNPSFGESAWKHFEPSSSYRQVSLSELLEVLKKLM